MLSCLIAISPRAAFGWGRDGHEIVARIAEARLTPQAKASVADLLDQVSLPEIASWADEIRKQRAETSTWHYVDIPYEMKSFDPARDGKNGNNIVEKIREFAVTLNDSNRPRAERAEALMFLVHFVGDIHQPMHCAERNDDKGGNFRLVFFPGEKKASNLHKIWDTSILKRSMGKTSVSDFAAKLNDNISKDNARAWSRGDPVQWANEAHRLAVEIAYRGVPADGPPPRISEDYLAAAQPTVDQQLQRAGLRLANLLNQALR